MSLPSFAARTLAAGALVLFSAAAWAQDALPSRLAAASSLEATRWPAAVGGENPVTLRLDKGAEVDVLTQVDDQLRVRQGLTFGWVTRTDLTGVAPTTPKVELGAPPPSFR